MVFFRKKNLINLIIIALFICLFLGVSFVFADLNLGDESNQIILQNNILGNNHQIINVSKLTIATTTTSTYSLNIEGDVYVENNVYTKNLNSSSSQNTNSAANVSAGEFGANTGGGNYSFPSNLSAGSNNTNLLCFSVILGGEYSTTSEVYTGIFAGAYNKAAQSYSTVLGGQHNQANGFESSILGGEFNVASTQATDSVIIAGSNNNISGRNNIILGGEYNNIFDSAFDSGIIGGKNNSVNNNYAVVIGGENSTSSGDYSIVIGGKNNFVSGDYSTIIGGISNKTEADLSMVLNSQNTYLTSQATNTFVALNLASSEQIIDTPNTFLINPSNIENIKAGLGNRIDFWTIKANMPTNREYLAVGAVNNKIYAIGGSKINQCCSYVAANEEYDPSTDTWTTKADLPTLRYGLAIGVVNNKIYAIGGVFDNGSDDIVTSTNEEYDPSTDTWTTKANMPTARQVLAIGVVNNKIYAIGGSNNTSLNPSYFVKTNEEYDPSTNTWTTKADMPYRRAEGAAVGLYDKIYYLSGDSYDETDKVLEYNPSTNTWTAKSSVKKPVYNYAAAVANNKIYMIGGNLMYSGEATSTVQEYDPLSDSFRLVSPMVAARAKLGASVVNGKIYAIGGSKSGSCCTCGCGGQNSWNNFEYTPPYYSGIVLEQTLSIGRGIKIGNTSNNNQGTIKFSNNTFQGYTDSYWQTLNIPSGMIIKASNRIYDNDWEYLGRGFDKCPWTTKTDMPTARKSLAIGVVNNKIYAIGGSKSECCAEYNENEEYDPSTNTWTTKVSMPTSRYGLAVGVINNKIYAVGGYNDSNDSVATNEEYDPSTNTWTTKANMLTKRACLAIGTVSNKIYAIGGYKTDGSSILSKNEEYDPSFLGDFYLYKKK